MLGDKERARIVLLRRTGMPIREVARVVKEEFNLSTLSPSSVLNIMKSADYIDIEESLMEEALNTKITVAGAKVWTKVYDKKVKEAFQYKATTEKLIEDFKEAIKNIKPYSINKKIKKREYASEAWLFFGDLHYGRTTEVLQDNITQMLLDLTTKERPYDHLNLCIMGDLIESPRLTGIHDSQVLDMDIFGVQQAIGCVGLLGSVIQYLNDAGITVSVYGLNGNHMRMSKSRDGDPERIVGVMMYEMLKKQFPNVEFTYSPNGVLTIDRDDIRIILAHGDNGFNNMTGEKVMGTLGQRGKTNIIASGHWHVPALSTGNGYLKIGVPSMNVQSKYERDIFISNTQPGYVLLTTLEGKANVDFRSV